MLEHIPSEPGVYGAYNLNKQSLYVGASKDMQKRCAYHVNSLKWRSHDRRRLVGDKDDQVVFGVIELCSMFDISEKEQAHYDSFTGRYKLLNKTRPNGKDFHHLRGAVAGSGAKETLIQFTLNDKELRQLEFIMAQGGYRTKASVFRQLVRTYFKENSEKINDR